jgi:hypothetical protein
MTITLDLPPETEQKLRERAAAVGKDVGVVATELLQRAVAGPTLEEILAPFRRQFADSGMADDELAAVVEQAREEVWQEKRAKKAT